MVCIKLFVGATAACRLQTHQNFAVSFVLSGQADPHPLVVSVPLTRLPTRLPQPVSYETMRTVYKLWVIWREDVFEAKQHVTYQPLSSVCVLCFILYSAECAGDFYPVQKVWIKHQKGEQSVVIWSISQHLFCYRAAVNTVQAKLQEKYPEWFSVSPQSIVFLKLVSKCNADEFLILYLLHLKMLSRNLYVPKIMNVSTIE